MVPRAGHCLQFGLLPNLFHDVEVRKNITIGQSTVIFINFREENDIDLQLSGKLYDKVDGLEKADVLNNIRYREEQGLDTTELKDRLKVLVELEVQKGQA